MRAIRSFSAWNIQKMWKKWILESIGIVFFATGIALLINFYRPNSLSLLPPSTSPLNEGYPNNSISFSTFQEKLKKPGTIILDARSPEEFQQGHIPGAKNLPYYEFSDKAPSVLQGIAFDQEIITYCEGLECSNAEDLAFLLKENGYTKVKVFEGGWEEWTAHQMPIKKGKNND